MQGDKFTFKTKIWLYSGMAAWHFATLPKNLSDKIKKLFGDMARGWGSLPVIVSVGETSWKTSIFPDKKIGAYVLPIKSIVRKKEKIKAGDIIKLEIKILI